MGQVDGGGGDAGSSRDLAPSTLKSPKWHSGPVNGDTSGNIVCVVNTLYSTVP